MRATLVLTIAIMLFTIVSVVLAGDSSNVEAYQFKFKGENGTVNLELNSQTMGFGLHDLQPGDSRTTVTEDGTGITISRLAEVYALDVGSEVFEIPATHGPDHMNLDHETHHRIAVSHGMGDGLTILSKDPLDESQQATIRAALVAAGIVDEVEFLSPGLSMLEDLNIEQEIADDGNGERRMIIKRVISD